MGGLFTWDLTARVLAVIVAVHLGIELVLLLGDAGLWGQGRLRQSAYEYGGFWPGLLYGWQANYPGQTWAMFVTYGLLHGGPGHALVNMITLWSMGREVIEWAGLRGLALVYGASLLGGAGGYALLAASPQPMVGASGALFGLAGALMVWAYRDQKDPARARLLLVWVVGFLVAMNLAMWWALDGHIAWQTHLGGFLAGALVAWFLPPTAPHSLPADTP